MRSLFVAELGLDCKIVAVLSPLDRLTALIFVYGNAFIRQIAEPDIENVFALVARDLCLKLIGNFRSKARYQIVAVAEEMGLVEACPIT